MGIDENKMYEYLEEHAYVSKNKKSNYQFELTKERAECIANKYNSLVEEKEKMIKRLNNIVNKFEKWLEQEYAVVKANSIQEPNNPEWYIKWNERKNALDKLQELKGDDISGSKH